MSDKHQMIHADFLEWAPQQPENHVDLVFGSPPYEDARTYGIDFCLKGQDWVDWMVEVVRQSVRLSRGLVFFVMAGKRRNWKYQPVVEWLVSDLTRQHRIVCGPSPYVFHRGGIPGSGTGKYHRRDWEPVYAFAQPDKVPPKWTDNTAMGHPPKYALGGEMSYRLTDGTRRNQWGGSGTGKSGARKQNGERQTTVRPSHKTQTRRKADGSRPRGGVYTAPAIADPGNVIHCKVGGGLMGYDKADSDFASTNEAPFPVSLAEFFVRSFCPPGGTTLDMFGGSGTTAVVCHEYDRQSISLDLRQSQVELMRQRLDARIRLRQEMLF